ncbi:GntR family transcriptional regulator [Neobacillus cucumis]|uniref:GntR family transcriptional regulator n=1 Tax=Neobacillus cucumis TaxID=1740721 RepID=UPI002E1E77BA|nr:GntR family transcriptional regulator [Neobacillus cucumis]MED4227504.1 GntR family transcriptional regulator [Neobacillus cucumis]
MIDQMIHELGKQIIKGEIKPGDTLSKRETVSEIYGVSRTEVREAFKALATRRLVNRLETLFSHRSECLDTDVIVGGVKFGE